MSGGRRTAGGPSGLGGRTGRPSAYPRPAGPPDPDDLAARVAAAVAALPQVARLDGGPFGTVASHLPGRRVVGVRLLPGGVDETGVGETGVDGIGGVEIAVVARLGRPLPALAADVAAAARGVLGPVAVDVTFSDVVAGLTAVPPGPPAGP